MAMRSVNLQMIRGLAALAVMLFHAALFTSEKTQARWLTEVFSNRLGYYGVLTFFVLSGFLMERAVRRYDAPTFLAHRLVRLFPTYWLVFAAIHLVQTIRLDAWQPVPWLALSLVPSGTIYRPLHVEWSLVYEIIFYLVCTVLCLTKRLHPWFMLVWGSVCLAAIFFFGAYGTEWQPTWRGILFSGWNIGFVAGGLAAVVFRKAWPLSDHWLLVFGLSLIGSGEILDGAERLVLASMGVAALVLVVVRAREPSEGYISRVLFRLGECSYGLYLVHAMAIQIALQHVPTSWTQAPVTLFCGMVALALGLGLLAGSMDTFVYRHLKALVDRLRAATLAREVGATLGGAGPH
jgi:exopolysaccharide production protein ExoZ